jgi:hypothetical protein
MPPPELPGLRAEQPLTVVADCRCAGCGYNLRGLPADGVCPRCGQAVSESVPHPCCADCGYDLHGLPEDGACPECGSSIRESIRRQTRPVWLQRARSGLTIYIACAAIGLLLSLNWVLARWVVPLQLAMWFSVTSLIALAARGLQVYAAFRITAPPPRPAEHRPLGRLRPLVRAFAIASLLASVLSQFRALLVPLTNSMTSVLVVTGAAVAFSHMALLLCLVLYLRQLLAKRWPAGSTRAGILISVVIADILMGQLVSWMYYVMIAQAGGPARLPSGGMTFMQSAMAVSQVIHFAASIGLLLFLVACRTHLTRATRAGAL